MNMSRPSLWKMAVLILSVLAVTAWSVGPARADDTYDEKTIIDEAVAFFGKGAEGMGKVIEKVFAELGRPNGYIKGEEAGGALVVGLRYGSGKLRMKTGATRTVHWNSPSIGIDAGGNAAKVFVLIYNLSPVDNIFRRYPAVDGSLYYVGGVGVNYNQLGKTILAPIRLGVGWRAGVSLGYIHYRKKKSWNPF